MPPTSAAPSARRSRTSKVSTPTSGRPGSRSDRRSRPALWSWTGSSALIRSGHRHSGTDSHADRHADQTDRRAYSRG
jgi:hypothetical protein